MIHNNIKSERVKLGWTQEELGKYLGVDESTIRRWEKGASAPSASVIAMSNLFGCSIDYLFGITDERKTVA